MLLGRRSECAVLDRLLEAGQAGRSGALVLRGEAGVGNTALLEYAIGSAADLSVVRAVGVESEREFAFAGLHQLCLPMLDRLKRLPGPQGEAHEVTFGLRGGVVPDRFFVSVAVLGLLAEAAAGRPLVCVVDDAQWLDSASAQTLAFVARRLLAESVVLLRSATAPPRGTVGAELSDPWRPTRWPEPPTATDSAYSAMDSRGLQGMEAVTTSRTRPPSASVPVRLRTRRRAAPPKPPQGGRESRYAGEPRVARRERRERARTAAGEAELVMLGQRRRE